MKSEDKWYSFQERDIVEGNKYISWIEQNSCNLSLDNPALEKNSTKTGSFAFYQRKALSLKQVDLRDMFKKSSRSVCTVNVMVSPDPLSPVQSTSGDMETPEKTENYPNDPELAAEGDIQM